MHLLNGELTQLPTLHTVGQCLFFFKDPKQDSMKIIMERFHQKLMEVMLVIRLTYAGNKLVELMHLNARVAKPNLSSSSKKESSFFLAKERRQFVYRIEIFWSSSMLFCYENCSKQLWKFSKKTHIKPSKTAGKPSESQYLFKFYKKENSPDQIQLCTGTT